MDAPDNLLGGGLSGLSIRILPFHWIQLIIYSWTITSFHLLNIWHISYKIALVEELRLGAYSIKTNLI